MCVSQPTPRQCWTRQTILPYTVLFGNSILPKKGKANDQILINGHHFSSFRPNFFNNLVCSRLTFPVSFDATTQIVDYNRSSSFWKGQGIRFSQLGFTKTKLKAQFSPNETDIRVLQLAWLRSVGNIKLLQHRAKWSADLIQTHMSSECTCILYIHPNYTSLHIPVLDESFWGCHFSSTFKTVLKVGHLAFGFSRPYLLGHNGTVHLTICTSTRLWSFIQPVPHNKWYKAGLSPLPVHF